MLQLLQSSPLLLRRHLLLPLWSLLLHLNQLPELLFLGLIPSAARV